MSGSTATISFDEISYDIYRPQTVTEIAANEQNIGLVGFPSRTVLFGQIAAGTASPGKVYRIFRPDQGKALFGPFSMLAQQIAAFMRANTATPLFAAGLPPLAGGTAASGPVTMTGTGIAVASTVPFYIAGRYAGLIVTPGDSLATQAANFAAVVNADPLLPVSAASAGGVATLTAKMAGECGNAFLVRIGANGNEMQPPGFACTIAPFVGGTGNPDITPLLAAIATEWYTDLQTGWTDARNLASLQADLERRYLATGRLDMHAYAGLPLSLGAAMLAGPTSNSRFLTRVPASKAGSLPWEFAASLTGIAAFQLNNDPQRQLRSLALPGILPPAPEDRYLDEDREQLLRNGMSTFDVLSDGTVVLERVITSCQQSSLGIPDRAWLDIMTPKTMSRIRWDWGSYVGLVYPRAKLADDDTPASLYSDAVATPRRMRNSWAGRCKLYEQLAWIENASVTSAAATFVRDPSSHNRLNARQQVLVVGNLMVLAGRLEFIA